MPFRSVRQRRFLFANHPEIARKWAHKYGTRPRRKTGKMRYPRRTKTGYYKA